MLPKDLPDHHDADLVIKLYKLRRETVMRESRHAITAKFWPRTAADVLSVLTDREHELNAPLRQISSYWEMVYSFARHGIVEPEFLLESNGEGLFLYARVEPFIEEIRRATNPRIFRNTEWVVRNTQLGADMMETFRARVKTVLAKG